MKHLLKIIKKLFFYFILFTGLVLSSMIFDSFIDTSDDSGYLIASWYMLFSVFYFRISNT